jgi:hypothetical protein
VKETNDAATMFMFYMVPSRLGALSCVWWDLFSMSCGGSMVVEGTLTHPCPSFAVGKLAMVVVRVQGAPPQSLNSFTLSDQRDSPGRESNMRDSQSTSLAAFQTSPAS